MLCDTNERNKNMYIPIYLPDRKAFVICISFLPSLPPLTSALDCETSRIQPFEPFYEIHPCHR